MTTLRLTMLLRDHGVQYRLSGRLEALDVGIGPDGQDASQWVDVTGWKASRVYRWLGY